MPYSRRIPSEASQLRSQSATAITAARVGVRRVDGDFDLVLGGVRDLHCNRHTYHGHGKANEDEEDAGFVDEVSRAEGV
jgi:hypothetical protein